MDSEINGKGTLAKSIGSWFANHVLPKIIVGVVLPVLLAAWAFIKLDILGDSFETNLAIIIVLGGLVSATIVYVLLRKSRKKFPTFASTRRPASVQRKWLIVTEFLRWIAGLLKYVSSVVLYIFVYKRITRSILIGIASAILIRWVLVYGVPYWYAIHNDKLRIVIARFEGPEYKDDIGRQGLTRNIVSVVNSKLGNSDGSQLAEVVYTYQPVGDLESASSVAAKYGANLVVWGTWVSTESELQILIGIKSFGNFWLRRGNSYKVVFVDDIIEKIIPSEVFLSEKSRLEQSIYIVARYLTLFKTQLLPSKEAMVHYVLNLREEISGSPSGEALNILNLALVDIYLSNADYVSAEKLVDTCLVYLQTYEPDNDWFIADCHAQKAFIEEKKQNFGAASAQLEFVTKLRPDLYEAQHVFADVYYQTRDTASLRQLAVHLFTLFSDSSDIFEVAGRHLMKLGNPRLGLKCLIHVDSLKGEFDTPLHSYHLGGLALTEGKSEEATRHFEMALSIRPCFVPAKVRLGASLFDEKKYAQCLDLINACELSNTFEENTLWRLKVECFFQLDMIDSGTAFLSVAIDSTSSLKDRVCGTDQYIVENNIAYLKYIKMTLERATSPGHPLKQFRIVP